MTEFEIKLINDLYENHLKIKQLKQKKLDDYFNVQENVNTDNDTELLTKYYEIDRIINEKLQKFHEKRIQEEAERDKRIEAIMKKILGIKAFRKTRKKKKKISRTKQKIYKKRIYLPFRRSVSNSTRFCLTNKKLNKIKPKLNIKNI